MKLSKELMEKAKTAKTPEELILLAKKEGVDLTIEGSIAYLDTLNHKSGELLDNELENVSGGCGDTENPLIENLHNTCPEFICKICNRRKEIHDNDHKEASIVVPYKECNILLQCSNCKRATFLGDGVYCVASKYIL